MDNKNIARAGAGLAFALLLALFGQFANAQDASSAAPSQSEASQPFEPGTGHHRKFDCAKGTERINAWNQVSDTLSQEQKQQIDRIKKATRDNIAPLQDQLKAIEADLKADPTGDDAAQRKAELRSLHQQMRIQFQAGREKMMAVLTDAQRAQLKAAFKNAKS